MPTRPEPMQVHFRVARPTDNLESIVEMYRHGLCLEVLGSFQNHDGFDGAMLGCPGAQYHLEFTHQHGQKAARSPSPEHLLVFYLSDPK